MATMAAGTIFTSDAGVTEINPIFDTNDYVYVKSEYPDGNATYKYNPYQVVSVFVKSDGTDVVGADGTSVADSTATPDVSTTDEDVTNDTDALFPWFYRLQNVNDGSFKEVHETGLKSLAGVQARVAAAGGTWTNPA